MKVKTSELIGRPLDYAAAIALVGTYLQFDTAGTWRITIDGRNRALSRGWSTAQNFSPSTDWSQGGLIIEALRDYAKHQLLIESDGDNVHVLSWPSEHVHFSGYGPTVLIAAMRCFVASKLGDEVEVPEELL